MNCSCSLGRTECDCCGTTQPMPTEHLQTHPADLEETKRETEGGAMMAATLITAALIAAGYGFIRLVQAALGAVL